MSRRAAVQTELRQGALWTAAVVAVLAFTAPPLETAHANQPPTLLWSRQANLRSYGYVSAVAADSAGNVVVAGPTYGAFGGPNKGGGDVFVALYAPDGTPRWRRQVGTSDEDGEPRVVIDGAGNVAAAGSTRGSLAQCNHGSYDAFVVMYAGDRTVRWKRQAGTRRDDTVRQVATDTGGNVVVAGNAASAEKPG